MEIRRGDEGRELLANRALAGALTCPGGGPEGGGGNAMGGCFWTFAAGAISAVGGGASSMLITKPCAIPFKFTISNVAAIAEFAS